jgi:betaine-homocysteine S-methyltransferase
VRVEVVGRGAAPRRRVKKQGILERLAVGPVLGDGGYLLELEKRGYVQAGPFTPEAVIEHPEAVLQLHREFVQAGSEVLQALTFYASKEKLGTTGFADRVEEINRQAVRLAHQAAGERVLVAGNLSLTWMYDPKDAKSEDRVRALFDQQLDLQVSEGIDFVICETYSYLREALLAVERSRKTGLPVMATMCFEKKPLSADGKTAAECARALEDAGADIVGVNCLWNPRHMLPVAKEMRQAVSVHVACQPTAYHTPDDCPDFTATKNFPFEMDGMQLSRRDMAEYAREARAAGIAFIGACCGAVASHIREMARALDKRPAQDRSWRINYGKPMSAYEYYDHHERPPAAR